MTFTDPFGVSDLYPGKWQLRISGKPASIIHAGINRSTMASKS